MKFLPHEQFGHKYSMDKRTQTSSSNNKNRNMEFIVFQLEFDFLPVVSFLTPVTWLLLVP